jgi:hypothetical protein
VGDTYRDFSPASSAIFAFAAATWASAKRPTEPTSTFVRILPILER